MIILKEKIIVVKKTKLKLKKNYNELFLLYVTANTRQCSAPLKS